jgi:hypothetical protein
MPDRASYSPELLVLPIARNDAALDRIAIAKNRIQSVLDREIVAHQKTLEQKIAEQGPTNMRVDPHLIGHAIFDLRHLNRLADHHHNSTGNKPWYANIGTTAANVQGRLAELAPLYQSVTGGGFGNQTGDALEIVVFKCLDRLYTADPKYAYQGYFDLAAPTNAEGRHPKVQPPKNIGRFATQKEADFLQFGHTAGPLCLECKNYREWIYPHHQIIIDLISKASDLNAVPVLIARRLHYTTRTNLLEPAGIIAHESYFQYYPPEHSELADKVRHKRSLGFTDIIATDEPHERTTKFISKPLPKIAPEMGKRWAANKAALVEYAQGSLNLAQLYNAIGSPAAGNWQELEHEHAVEDPEAQ